MAVGAGWSRIPNAMVRLWHEPGSHKSGLDRSGQAASAMAAQIVDKALAALLKRSFPAERLAYSSGLWGQADIWPPFSPVFPLITLIGA